MKRSTIIICIIALMLLSAGIAALVLWPEPEPEPEPVIHAPAETEIRADLVNEAREDIAGVYFTPPEGMSFAVRYDTHTQEYSLDGVDVVFPGRQFTMSNIFTNVSRLINLLVVTERADDSQLDMFGLLTPAMIVRIERVNGSTIDIDVGNMPAAGQGRYARIHNSREVFILTDTQSQILTLNVEDVYDLTFFPLFEFEDGHEAMLAVRHLLIDTGTTVFELRQRTGEELDDADIGESMFHFLQPAAAEANDNLIQSAILENILQLTPGIIESVRPEDLSVYGLDEPAKVTISTEDWSGTLLIGERDAQQGGRYVMIEGHDAVLLDTDGDYSFLNLNFSQLRSGLIWIHNIVDVESVIFKLEDSTRVLRFEHNPADESLLAWLDDEEISDSNGRRLFVAALMLSQSGETNEPIPTDTPPLYSVTMNFTDGSSSDTLELYQLSESQFLIVHSGASTALFITRMSIQQNLLSRFEILDAGGDLPMA